MKKKNIKKTFNKNLNLIKKYNHNYFNLDSPLVTDEKYDQLKSKLIEMSKKHTYLNRINSDLGKVGAPLSKKFKKIKHSKPMLSLSNTFDEKGMSDFISKIANYLSLLQQASNLPIVVDMGLLQSFHDTVILTLVSFDWQVMGLLFVIIYNLSVYPPSWHLMYLIITH